MMKICDVVIGNSSSGIAEAPALKRPTVNIGNRQKGRLKAGSIIDCSEEKEAIVRAIRQALSHEFQRGLNSIQSVYGEGNAAFDIKEQLKKINIDRITQKVFYDI
jgi:UDP-N-acetylglucosamine 2-epimerase (non-hydrolysing)/GDP/UDP-N,N'-diacetylbacillosamine 2-epimerase (hydrolysing)